MKIPFPPEEHGFHILLLQGGMLLLLLVFLPLKNRVLPSSATVVRRAVFAILGVAFVLVLSGLLIEEFHRSTAVPWPAYAWTAVGVILLVSGLTTKPTAPVSETTPLFGGAVLLSVFWAFLAGSMASARPAALRSQCRQNLASIGGKLVEESVRKGRFPAASEQKNGGPLVTWRVTSLNSRQAGAAIAYDRAQTWDAEANLLAAQSETPVYSCPANWNVRDERGRWLTSYVLVTGPGTIFPNGNSLAPHEISDGTSRTLLCVEAAGLQIVWSEPRDADVSREPIGINLPGDKVGRSPGLLSSYHPSGALAVMADGSVQFLSEQIDLNVLRALTTANGRDSLQESIPNPFD